MLRNLCISIILALAATTANAEGYDIVVDRNGRGDFRNIQDAVNSIRAFDPAGRTTVFIMDGVYKEKLEIPTHLVNVRFVGESAEKTVITYDDHANIDSMGTFRSHTLIIRGNDIVMENLTVENSSLPLGQAVALHIEGDRTVFRRCRIVGNQDTIYAGRAGCRAYFEDCLVEGTTDFIFGPATCWFERCTIRCKKNSYITAASTPQNVEFGFVFNDCRVTIAGDVDKVYLGRPWRAYAMTLFMNCLLPAGIRAEGWDNWRNPENEKTARYMEYGNRGPGAQTSARAAWTKTLTPAQAEKYTLENVMKGRDGWNPNTI